MQDPTDLLARAEAQHQLRASAATRRQQEDSDVASILATPAGKRLFARLLRTRYLEHADPIVQSAARAAPKVLAEIIVGLAAETHPPERQA